MYYILYWFGKREIDYYVCDIYVVAIASCQLVMEDNSYKEIPVRRHCKIEPKVESSWLKNGLPFVCADVIPCMHHFKGHHHLAWSPIPSMKGPQQII